jgi:signal transduction histidine kinase
MRSRRTPSLVDALLAVVLSGLSVATIADRGSGPGGWFAVTLALLAVAPIALRQVAPVLTLVVISAALAAYALLGYGDWPSSAVGLLVAMLTVALLRPRAVATLMFVPTTGVVILGTLTVQEVTWIVVAQAVLVLLGAWALGDATRRWAQEAENAASRSERAVARERTLLARELHDVVTHHMSVVALQSGVADYVLDTDPALARTAIGHAGAASRDGLVEMRRMLDTLRSDEPEAAPYEPQPGLRQVEVLVARLRNAGLGVEVHWAGTVRTLPPGVELCAYRTIQESLTNVLKHAGPDSAAVVHITFGERVLTVEIRDDGRMGGDHGEPGEGRATGQAGHGLRGMRERAELYDGVLDAGPAPAGGFGVRLRLSIADIPLEPAAPAQDLPALGTR